MTHFVSHMQNSYLLRAFEFGYYDLGFIVTSPTATFFVSPL